ncbi:MAG TPA: DMT family transporter [Longimicrobiales bacterium]
MPANTRTRTRTLGYLFAVAAGATWGTTGPLSTALYAEGAQLTQVGFWRVALATIGFVLFGLIFKRDIFKIDRNGLLLIALAGGALVALFEIAFQYAIAGVGVAGAVALLYTAPVIVAVLGRLILREALTPLRLLLAIVVMIGVGLTVNGSVEAAGGHAATEHASRVAGIVGGLLAAVSYTGTTLLARYTVPRYGATRVLFYELLGGTLMLAVIVPIMSGGPLTPPATAAGWIYIAALGIGSVLAANFFFFAAVKRIDAAPTAVAASVEPLVGALLALLLFGQQLLWFGWLGLAMVVAGVGGGYKEEAAIES